MNPRRASVVVTRSAAMLAIIAASVGCASDGRPGGSVQAEPEVTSIEMNEMRERAFTALVELTADTVPNVRANAVEALEASSVRVDAVLRRSLKDPNPGVRSIAAVVAGRSERTAFVEDLRGLRNDPSPYVRAAASFALHRFGVPADLTPISWMLFAEDARARGYAAYLLGELGDESALLMLQESASDPMDWARPVSARLAQLQIAEAMYRLGYQQAIQEVRAALYPATVEDLEATALAVQILGEVGDKPSIDQLVYLTARTDGRGNAMPAEIQMASAVALAKMGQSGGLFIAEEFLDAPTETVRAQAAYGLGELGGRGSLADLEALLADESSMVRVAAASAVVRLTDRLARESLGRPGTARATGG